MKHLYHVLMIVLFVFISTVQIYAQIPKELTYQGQLFDSQGAPANGVFRMTFSMYDDMQSQQFIHQETLDVTIENGYYAVSLGMQNLWLWHSTNNII